METPPVNRFTIGFALTLLLLVCGAVVSHVTLNKLVAAYHVVAESERAIKLLSELRATVVDGERSQREFIIAGEERFLEAYLNARPSIAASLKELSRLAASDAEQTARLVLLGSTIDKRFEFLNEAIAIRRDRGAPVAASLIRNDQGIFLMNRIRNMLDVLQNQEGVILAARTGDAEFKAYVRTLVNTVATFVNICLLGGLFLLMTRDAAARRKSVAAQSEISDKFATSVAELQQRNEEITILGQLSSFLQTCASAEEACAAISRFGPRLFPTETGVIYLFDAARKYVESAASWSNGSDQPARDELFTPADCWALRRGRVHSVGTDGTTMICAHVARASKETPSSYICAPMIAQGESLGLLFLQSRGSDGTAKTRNASRQELAAAVAEQLALSLSNLWLRESLRQQSVRDPLTGLYNRRFLEETLDRELSRLERKNLPLSLIMIDVDKFKDFNDTFGHAAGDAVLRDLGSVLQRFVRGGDIACRFGGEEFTVILPEASLEIGRQRAEMLREAVREMHLVHEGKALGPVTLSLGVACFPEHGRRRDHLLEATDAALYEAKSSGRNCVIVSNLKTLKVVENPLQRERGGH